MARTPGKLDAESWHAQVEVVTADVPEFFAVEPRWAVSFAARSSDSA